MTHEDSDKDDEENLLVALDCNLEGLYNCYSSLGQLYDFDERTVQIEKEWNIESERMLRLKQEISGIDVNYTYGGGLRWNTPIPGVVISFTDTVIDMETILCVDNECAINSNYYYANEIVAIKFENLIVFYVFVMYGHITLEIFTQ